MSENLALTSIFLGALQLGCTFVTRCPCADDQGNPNHTGGMTGGGAGGTNGGGGGIGGQKPEGDWINVTANLADLDSECGNMSLLSSKPDEDMLIAGIAQRGLWASTDGGTSWQEIGQGTGSDEITNRTTSIAYDPNDPTIFWESGIYNGGGVYKTLDDGDTFAQQGEITHVDVVSIDFTDPNRQTLLAGPHEQRGVLYLSTDGGGTWDDIGGNLPSDLKFSHQPYVLDASTFLLGCSGFTDGESAIVRSTDGGETWDRVSDSGAARPPVVAEDGTIFWVLENNQGLLKSSDLGETWEGAGNSLTIRPVLLPDGRLATTTNQNVIISDDAGETWSYASPDIPFEPGELVYSAFQKAFFVSHLDCNDTVPADAIMRYDFDYEAP